MCRGGITDNFLLSGLKNREERERQYFDTGLPATSSALMNEDVVEDDELYDRVSLSSLISIKLTDLTSEL